MQQHVNLIEGHPIFHFMAITLEECARIPLVEANELAILPAAIGLHEIHRQIEMTDRHDRLNTIFQ
ncbi:hypothetical protein D1872_317710 [compost metagenome]